MTPENRKNLAELIRTQRDSLMTQWRDRVRPLLSARALEVPILNDEIPLFLDELAERVLDIDAPFSWIEEAATESKIDETATSHGQQRFRIGYDIVEVIKEYGILREILYERAESQGLVIGGKGGHALNFAFNKAAAMAVESFQKEKELEIHKRRREYLAFIMHDLKTPLNAIMVAATVIEQTVDDPKMVSEMVRIIVRNGEQLDALLQKTIKLERSTIEEGLEDFVPRTFELWPVAQSVIDEFRLIATDSRITVHNLVPAGLTVHADAVALKTILRNLLSNAMKYSVGGKVMLGVVTSMKDTLELWVRDSGDGIPPERLSTLFEKVAPDPAKKGSSGLGLFMVKKLVEAHAGTVSVDSTVGEGSTFRIFLPQQAGS
ncbi:MAG TPA: sensor histidine kinase [Candidatus Kapabacteria bacterium]